MERRSFLRSDPLFKYCVTRPQGILLFPSLTQLTPPQLSNQRFTKRRWHPLDEDVPPIISTTGLCGGDSGPTEGQWQSNEGRA